MANLRSSLAVLCAALILLGCGVTTADVDTTPVTGSVPPSSPTSGLPSTTTQAPAVTDSAESVPISGTYGFVSIEITDASIANITPGSYLTDDQEPSDDRYLFLKMEVDNTSRGYTANWLPSPYGLLVGGEPAPVPEVLAGRPNVGLTAGQVAEVVVAYRVGPDVTFDDLEFTFAAEGTIPLVMPISGVPAAWPWPVELPLNASADLSGDGVSCGQSITVDITGAEASIDLLDTEGNFQGSRRAMQGHRFLTVRGRVTNHGGQRCGGGATNVTGDTVRLYVDTIPRPPVGFVNITVPPEAAEDFEWHFAYPTDSSEIEFVFGDPDTAHLAVPIDVSSVP